MKSNVLISFFTFALFGVLFSNPVYGQNNSFSVGVSHPIPIGDTFFSNYDGIAGFDIKYSHSIHRYFSVGAKLGYSRSKIVASTIENETTTYSNIYRGMALFSFTTELWYGISITPELGFGYAFVTFNNDEFQNQSDEGINTAFLLSFNRRLSNKFSLGVFSSYEFIYNGKPKQAIDTPYNKEMHWLNVGLRILYKLD